VASGLEIDMLTLGGLLVAGSIVLLIVLTPIFRSPDPPSWTTAPLVGELVSIGLVSMAACGIAFAGAAAAEMIQHGVDLFRLGLMIAVVLAIGLIGRQIVARALRASAR
jgi:hypothetical protein